jgi:hypothetical protein
MIVPSNSCGRDFLRKRRRTRGGDVPGGIRGYIEDRLRSEDNETRAENDESVGEPIDGGTGLPVIAFRIIGTEGEGSCKEDDDRVCICWRTRP